MSYFDFEDEARTNKSQSSTPSFSLSQSSPAPSEGISFAPSESQGLTQQQQTEEFKKLDIEEHSAKIMVFGVGGGGCNTISRLTRMDIKGAVTMAANTDAKHLASTISHKKILIGKSLTRGLGAGGYPEVGKKAVEETRHEVQEMLRGCDLLFVTCGLGGGTGTGGAPEIAKVAREMGAIVITAVTLPFKMEGARVGKAEAGLMRLRDNSDTVIVIENQKLLEIAGQKPLAEAFAVADGLIATMIKGITETISQPSLVNLDYADVKTIMHSGGVATIGIGESNSANRAEEAIKQALNHPLLDVDYQGATGALIQIIGGDDMRLDEISLIGETVSKQMSPDAMVMWGARILPHYKGKIQVITIITGVKSPYIIGRANDDRAIQDMDDLGIPVHNRF
ncbi:MAG: cell division protein FtsZ [Candidatus Aenigmatarchaeota archaeon]